jgi:hypothetical protein
MEEFMDNMCMEEAGITTATAEPMEVIEATAAITADGVPAEIAAAILEEAIASKKCFFL